MRLKALSFIQFFDYKTTSRYITAFSRSLNPEPVALNRPVSPIRHDYRPNSLPTRRRKNPRILWFVLGLGMPLATLGLVLGGDRSADASGASAATIPLQAATFTAPFTGMVDTRAVADINTHSNLTGIESQANIALGLMAPVAEPPARLYDTVELTVRSGDTLDRLFRKNDLHLGDMTTIVRLPAAKDPLRLLKPGDVINVWHEDGRVQKLTKEIDYANTLTVAFAGDGVFDANITPRAVEIREAMRHGTIESSLFESAAEAGLDDNMIMNLAGIFAWDIDFVLDIRKHDEYYILFEEIWQDDRRVADGEVIAAEFVNNGRVVQAVRHIDAEGRSDYFAPDGRSIRKAFIRAPVDFTRVSSNFNPRRRHPVLNKIRAHRGVDYAAPKGTAIKASGDGRIVFRGRNGGYGNSVIVQHGGNITTLYAHMSQFSRNARLGTRVRQGQTIGRVGSTGLATAAHLHYEYRVNGVHRNPRTVKLPAAEPIPSKYKEDFLQSAAEVLERLDRYKRTRLARLD